jgi:hypothetical protein
VVGVRHGEEALDAATRARQELQEGVTIVLGDACEPYVLEEAKLAQGEKPKELSETEVDEIKSFGTE